MRAWHNNSHIWSRVNLLTIYYYNNYNHPDVEVKMKKRWTNKKYQIPSPTFSSHFLKLGVVQTVDDGHSLIYTWILADKRTRGRGYMKTHHPRFRKKKWAAVVACNTVQEAPVNGLDNPSTTIFRNDIISISHSRAKRRWPPPPPFRDDAWSFSASQRDR